MTDLNKQLDEIAEEAALEITTHALNSRTAIKNKARSAIDKAFEAVLTREPSPDAVSAAYYIQRRSYSPLEMYRAMSAALLKSLKERI